MRRAAFRAIMQKMTGLLRAALPLQFIPARGRKQPRLYITVVLGQLQFIPARGRKHVCIDINVRFCALQFIPARGRKHVIILASAPGASDCNLSPQGDGNQTSRPSDHAHCVLQFIPARGRKPASIHHFCPSFIAIYPRKGTETISTLSACLSVISYCNLSPQGDGNDFTVCRNLFFSLIAIYPRKGTETEIVGRYPIKPLLPFIPARGRKRGLVGDAVLCDNCNLSLQGDGN